MNRQGRWTGRGPWTCRALCALLLCAGPAGGGLAAQETATLFGRVTGEDEAPVRDAALLLGTSRGTLRTVLSDADGRYLLAGIDPGRYSLRVERLGFVAEQREIALGAGERRRLDLRLRVDTLRIPGVVVQGRRDRERERARFENEAGVTARVVEGPALKSLPGLAEADVLRAVELLPGVVSTSDFSSSFNVRGGSADQNLILLDGFPVFNPFHLGGLFSVFNSDAVARAELFAGGFGVEHGGRVSSVLRVESRDEPVDRVRVDAGVSMLASRVLVRAPFPGARGGGWFLSARRSYFDQLLRPWVDFPYYLVDGQGHAAVPLPGGGRLGVTAYAGADVLDLSDFRTSGGQDSSSVLRVRWNWGNRVLGARWQQPVGRAWTMDTRLGFSGFAEELGFVDFGDVRFASRVRQLSLRSDWARDLSSTTSLRTGVGLDRLRYENRAEAGGTVFLEGAGRGVLGSAFAGLRWRPDDSWLVEPGARLDAWAAGNRSRLLPSPRVAVKRFLGERRSAAAKLAVGRYTQFLHSLRNEELPISNDTWITADRDVPPLVSDQLQLGVESYWGDEWSASLEAYLRTFRGVVELNLADDPNDPADDVLSGRGRSHGLDLLVRRNGDRLSGWITLSLLRARRTLPDPTAAGWSDLPPEVTYPPVFDRRVDVDLVLQSRLPGEVELGARWNYGSPLPYTRPTGQYFGWRYNPLHGEYEPVDRRGERPPLFLVLGPRNAERYPPYHRLDVTARRTFRRAWGSFTPYLQVLNAYNRRNVLFYFSRYDRVPPTRSGFSQFPVLPALGVEASF